MIIGLLSALVLMSFPARANEASQLQAVLGIVEAVNAKDANGYVKNFAEDVVIRFHGGDIRLRGRAAIHENRQRHFSRFPQVRNELVHLVSIDDKVVMHDRVWLDGDVNSQSADIVEIFTFKLGSIVEVEVIQPANLFEGRTQPPR